MVRKNTRAASGAIERKTVVVVAVILILAAVALWMNFSDGRSDENGLPSHDTSADSGAASGEVVGSEHQREGPGSPNGGAPESSREPAQGANEGSFGRVPG